jgi:hypothetical protein
MPRRVRAALRAHAAGPALLARPAQELLVFGGSRLMAERSKHLVECLQVQGFAIHQHAIHVENDREFRWV